MCFSTPKVEKPPPLPLPPNPMEANLSAEEALARKSKAAMAPRTGTVLTTPLGDPGYGSNVNKVTLTS